MGFWSGLFHMGGRVLNSLYYMFIRALFFLIVFVLYSALLSSSAIHARGSYLVTFYGMLMLLPPTLCTLLIPYSDEQATQYAPQIWRAKLLSGIALVTLLIIGTLYFRGLVSWATIFWLLVTVWAVYYFYKAGAKLDTAPPIYASWLRLVVVICVVSLFLRHEQSRFAGSQLPDAKTIRVASLPVSMATKAAIRARADVIVADDAYLANNSEYIFRVAPIHPTYFSLASYVVQGPATTLNELVSEMRLVSYVNSNGYGAGRFVCGLFKGAWGLVKGICFMVFHPIQTAEGAYAFAESTYRIAVDEPAGLISKPVAAFNAYRDNMDKDLAAQYGVDLNALLLPETATALSTHKTWGIAGAAAFETASFAVPLAKVGKLKYLAKSAEAGETARIAETIAMAERGVSRVTPAGAIGRDAVTASRSAKAAEAIEAIADAEKTAAKVSTVEAAGKEVSAGARVETELADVRSAVRADTKVSQDAVRATEQDAAKATHADDATALADDTPRRNAAKGSAGDDPGSSSSKPPKMGKKEFYPKVDEDLRQNGFHVIPEDELTQGKGANRYVKPGDGIAMKGDDIIVLEKKGPKEVSQTGIKNDYIKQTRADVDRRVANEEITPEVGLHETKLAQAEHNAHGFKDGITGVKGQTIDTTGKTIKPGYSVPQAESEAAEQALKNRGITNYEKIQGSNGTVTYIWDLPPKRPL